MGTVVGVGVRARSDGLFLVFIIGGILWIPRLWIPRLWIPRLWIPRLWISRLWIPRLWIPRLTPRTPRIPPP